MATSAFFDMLRRMISPNKISKKGGAKGSVVEGVFTVGVVCLKILIRESLFHGKREN